MAPVCRPKSQLKKSTDGNADPFGCAQGRLSTPFDAKNAPDSAQDDSLLLNAFWDRTLVPWRVGGDQVQGLGEREEQDGAGLKRGLRVIDQQVHRDCGGTDD